MQTTNTYDRIEPATPSRFICAAVLLLASTLVWAQHTIVFTDVNVIPMTAETVLENQTVVVRGNEIAAIGPSAAVRPPTDGTVIPGEGRYLIPGLMDMHIHLQGGRRHTPVMLKMFALTGVTTGLCMRGSSGVLDAREKVASGEWLGPRIFAASPILGNTSPNPKDYASGIEAVEQFAEDGYDFIKVYNQIPAEGYRGVMDAADRLGIPVIGHAVRSVGIDGAIERRQHIAHMEELIYGYFKENRDEVRIAPLAKRIKEADISVVATLIAYHNIIRQVRNIDAMLQSEGIEYMPEPLTRAWQKDRNDYVKRFTAEEADNSLEPAFAFQQKLVAAFVDAGIPVLAGTDAGIPIIVPGFSMHLELVELVEAGLRPYQALEAATTHAANLLGIADSAGTVEPGKRADIILLESNPLEDIKNTQRRAGVMVNGKWFDAEKIDEIFDVMREEAAND